MLEIELAMCYTKSVTASNGRILLPSNSPIRTADCQESRPGSCDKPTRTPGSRHFVFGENAMFVYLLESGGYFKIGVADNIKTRLKNLQTGNPHPIRLRQSFNLGTRDAAIQVEKGLHKLLRPINKSGEWFKIEPQDVWLFDETFSAIARGDMARMHALTDEWRCMLERIREL
jgi:predicted GIY-YIG superfamily endonuclease